MWLRRALAAALVLGLAGPGVVAAQDQQLTTPPPSDAPQSEAPQTDAPPSEATAAEALPSLILTVDTERAFSTSLFGVRLENDINAAAEELVAENNRIETELAAEEQALTDERATLDPVEFREKADAFDTKVQGIRAEQDAKAREVQSMRDNGEREFLTAVTPILAEIARERGAVLVFERQQILLSAESIDVTGEAIERLNARLSAEGDLTGDDDAPEATPSPDNAPPPEANSDETPATPNP